jgi:hypothetical protein
MNNLFDGITGIKQTTPPEVPPEFPFNSPVPAIQPNVPVPMVYVKERERGF